MKTVYHGIDLHSTNFKTHYIEETDGVISKQGTKTIYHYQLENLYIPFLTKNDYVCLEASCGAFMFAKKLRPYVKEVIIINPFDFKSLYMSGKKTDKIDAKKLCERLYTHIQNKKHGFEDNLPSIYIPEDHIIELRSLFSTYDMFKKQTTRIKNRLHSILKQNLIQYESSALLKSIYNILDRNKLNDIYKIQVKLFLEQLNTINEQITVIENEIKKLTYKHHKEEIELLISIIGIGFFSACAIISDYADINRFKNAKRFCSYLQAGMRVDSSNDKTYIGKLNKKARKLAFRMVLQELPHILNNNKDYENFKTRKSKGKSKGKIRCALVRKTLVSIFYMLKNKEKWRCCSEKKYKIKLAFLNMELKKANSIKQRA